MIKITSIEIDGFITPSQKVKLDFIESNVICIYGDNGSGKTSFLEILSAIFARDEEILDKYNINKISIAFLDEITPIIVERIINTKEWKDLLEIEMNVENIDIANLKTKYYWNQLEESKFNDISSLFLGIGRGIHKNKLKIPRNKLWHFFNTNRKIKEEKILTGSEIDDFSDKLVEYLMPKEKNNDNNIASYNAKELDNKRNIFLSNIEIDTIEQLIINKYQESIIEADRKINQALSQTTMSLFDNSLSKKINFDNDLVRDKLLYNKSLILEVFRINSKYDPYFIKKMIITLDKLEENKEYLLTIDDINRAILVNIIKTLEREVELFNEIQVFLDEYNSFLNYDKKLVLSSNGVFVKTETKNHSIQKLSSGERHLLTFLATILLMGEEQDFILLDEPEISLNVDWQRKILSTIAKLAPNAQVIVATHSPLVVEEHPQSLIELKTTRI